MAIRGLRPTIPAQDQEMLRFYRLLGNGPLSSWAELEPVYREGLARKSLAHTPDDAFLCVLLCTPFIF